jgi:hypothetical protein
MRRVENQLRQDMSFGCCRSVTDICNARYVGVVVCNFRGGIPRLGFRWITGAT